MYKKISILLIVFLGILSTSGLVRSTLQDQFLINRLVSDRPFEPPTLEYATYLPLITKPWKAFLPLISRSLFNTPHPAHDSSAQSLNVYLSWALSESSVGGTYTIYLEADDPNPDVAVVTGLTTLSYDPFTLEPDTQYYWRVEANHSDGRSTEGEIWTFHTEKDTSDSPDLDAMVTVPGGPFDMGCDRTNPYEDTCSYNIFHSDEPVRRVTVDAFEIDKYEVTNQEYKSCMDADVCSAPRRRDQIDDSQYSLYPVTYVSWWDAQTFCAWEGKRLPTEAEWEKAARGTIDTRKWPWGNEDPDCSRVNENSVRDGACELLPKGTVPVGRYPRGASPYGVYDMSGNVFEWVQDRYDVWYYNYAPDDNPQGPPYSRVTKTVGDPMQPPIKDEHGMPLFSIRGGSWRDNTTYMRVSHRHWGHHGDTPNTDAPYFRSDRVGFRCAR